MNRPPNYKTGDAINVLEVEAWLKSGKGYKWVTWWQLDLVNKHGERGCLVSITVDLLA